MIIVVLIAIAVIIYNIGKIDPEKRAEMTTGRAVGAVIIALAVFAASYVAYFLIAFGSDLTRSGTNIAAAFVISFMVICALMLIAQIYELYQNKIASRVTIAALCVWACALAIFGVREQYLASIASVRADNDTVLRRYDPAYANSIVKTLDEEAALRLTDDLPRMDGATALYPVYAAFANAVYPADVLQDQEQDVLQCTKTTRAYKAIVDGDADIIFVAGPSEEQEAYAAENGVELVYTPIGSEAFVFFVNGKNPLDNITVDEIKGIYSGEITQWETLGVRGLGRIRAFQRDTGSGSQSALIRMMGDTPIMEPTEATERIGSMGGIVVTVSDYKNFKNAIGYSFRFYATEMVGNGQIKLLQINGVAPVEENIANGTYPISDNFFAVTRKDADENTRALLKWICGAQGQELIQKTGYTPLME